MNGEEWLEGYSGQTTDELLVLRKTHRLDSLACAFERAVQNKAEEIGLDRLTEAERTILAVSTVDREVNNGGFEQFFGNSSCEFAPEIVASLQRIGFSEAAELAQDAIDALRIQGSVTLSTIEAVIEKEDEAIVEQLDALDSRFYDEIGDLSGHLIAYIAANRDSVVLPQ